MRRWQIVAGVASIALAVSGALVYRTSTGSVQPRGASPSSEDTARPLTYAVGQTIHLGDRSIRTGVDVLSLDVTDEGAAFTTFDGLLWFTDGKSLTQIGLTSPARVVLRGIGWSPAGRPNDRIVADYSGSRLAWLEYPRIGEHGEPPELVVYDSRERRRVARVSLRPMTTCPTCAHIVSVHDDLVYWTDGTGKGLGTSMQRMSKTRLYRYDLSTRRQALVSVNSYQAELRSRARTLVVGDTLDSGTVGDGIGQDFDLTGRNLVASGIGGGRSTFDPRSGRRVVFTAPASMWAGHGGERFYLFQWLDDDTVALLHITGWKPKKHRGEEMLLCTLSSGQCDIAPRQPTLTQSPIVPEFETPGASHAEARAARAEVLSGR